MPGSIRIGRLLGIPLQINVSWFVIFAAVTLSLVVGQFPAQYPFWSQSTYVIVGLITSLLFFGSVVIHELAHSLVARVIGIPVKSITLFIFGGVAQIGRDAGRPSGELIMAAAGPFSSFGLAALFALLWAVARPFNEPATALAGWLAGINLMLGAFNLVPGFPMDGGRVLRSLLWWATGSQSTATRIAITVGHLVAYGFLLGGVLILFSDRGSLFNGIWLAFIGWFLNQAASASARQARVRDNLRGYSARDLMVWDPPLVSVDASVQDVVTSHFPLARRQWAVVVEGPYLRGAVSIADIRKVPKGRWPFTRIKDVMGPVDPSSAVTPQTDALDVLERMEDREASLLPVVEDGVLAGVITLPALVRAADLRRDLGL